MKIDWLNQHPDDRAGCVTAILLGLVGNVLYGVYGPGSFGTNFFLIWKILAVAGAFVGTLVGIFLLVNLVDAILHKIFKD